MFAMSAGDWIAGAALVTAVVAICLPLWREQHAELYGEVETLYLRASGGDRTKETFFLVNAGPASAEDVTVRFFDDAGNEIPAATLIPALATGAIPALLPRQRFGMAVPDRSLGTALPTTAELSWRVGRRRRTKRTVALGTVTST